MGDHWIPQRLGEKNYPISNHYKGKRSRVEVGSTQKKVRGGRKIQAYDEETSKKKKKILT